MGEIAREILPVNIEDELKQSYLDYAMSVIIGRALPDVRDGLKPVHRRVLFAMHELGNDWNKAYKKSARVVGDVIGKYHPHGDSAVYDTIVRMAQEFSMRYVLVDGQGNFGSIDGDSAAAMRYTEVRMSRLAHELLADLEKDTVDWVDNYDGTERIPEVLPTKVPNLLVNGASGIAVGMATNIPPHNMREIIDGCLALIDDYTLSIDDLMAYIPGPDFPTGGIINGRAGILEAYRTGRGRIYVRARHTIEHDEKTGRDHIIVTELPYQVNKARLIEKIAELVKDKRIEGIAELRDESDKEGLRVVIEVKRGESGDVVVNNLFAHTQLQTVFGINMVALDNGQPKILNLKEILEAFVRHRREVVTRRTLFELKKARDRGHILEGLAVAISNIDEVIELIKASPSAAEAKEKLVARAWRPGQVTDMLERAGATSCKPEDLEEGYGLAEGQNEYRLSPAQAQAILELRLHRLTGLETEKLLDEYLSILKRIAELNEILASPERLLDVIREELQAIRDQYGDERKTEIQASHLDLTIEDLINEEDMVVTISRSGYAKTQPLSDYQAQRRGGRGKSATTMKDEDIIEHLLVASTHDTVLLFSNRGKVYWLKVYEMPNASRGSRGKPLINLLPLDEGEAINAILPVREYREDSYIFFATAKGTVKRTSLEQFSRPRSVGLIAIDLEEDDRLVGAAITSGNDHAMLLSSNGKAIRFEEGNVRAMGRTARGVRGMRLQGGAEVISLIIPQSLTIDAETDDDAEERPVETVGEDQVYILTASENGYGKRTRLDEFPLRGRGGQGVIAMQTSQRNGALVAAIQVRDSDEMMLITDKGTLVRTRVGEVSVSSRNTQGVTLIRTGEGEHLVATVRVDEPDAVEDDALDAEALDSEEGAATAEATPTPDDGAPSDEAPQDD
ncbi:MULTISPECIES: DNA gyrase subunit A [Chromohalobacter]|uniref:DNA gyrase subunit A n=1 Tax=Chromohalobacter israelensis (strain ATCC BAA-138 / DSM 3043 / CIP 106854 / NCIMB 13768 / 1H11) TaxID=290398 RepID=Q1QVI9_CHRI1|nr:DNA gyrase subunit A [Chromohalobacter salexigens]ABE59519.1 DNA gyrase subunit A [Chromohalobacter salexigens DSM 3043]MBZ5874711.1 DNA gyrase subunit A [Chromohalobacter salexigens]MDO0946336.1 DNA gyrase subunit A [Chromohalobacter salexigens]NWO56921.1 DNA gyrase subunit A [Chromohalobacter salexigens]